MRERSEANGKRSGEKAGCVAVRKTQGGTWEVILVESRWTRDAWAFPKGGIEDDEAAAAAARRETCEEAGVLGDLVHNLGTWRVGKQRRVHRMWVLHVRAELARNDVRWLERDVRRRAWRSMDDAMQCLAARPELCDILEAAQLFLADLDLGDHVDNHALAQAAESGGGGTDSGETGGGTGGGTGGNCEDGL